MPPQTAASTHTATANSCWQKAIDKLEPDLKSVLLSVTTQKLDIIGAVLKVAEDKRQLCIRKQWKYKTSSGKVIVLRDVLEKVVGWIDRFKTAGDIAMQYDPATAALPWAAFRFLLTIACGDVHVFGSVVAVLETVARIAARCRVLEELYLHRPCDMSGVIEEALLGLYTESLSLLAKVVRYFKKPTGVRVLYSIAQLPVSNDDINAIEAREKEVLKLASMADSKTIQALDTQVAKLATGTTSTLQDLSGRFTRVLDINEAMQQALEDKKLSELLHWLSPTPIALHHRAVADKRLPGSGQWLMDHQLFQQWESSSESSVLVLHGVRGSGKSTTFSAAVDHLRQRPTPASSSSPTFPAPCAYFYCADSPSQPERAAPEHVIRSVLRQLAVGPQNGTINQAVLSIYRRELKEAEKARMDPRELALGESIRLILDMTMANPAYIAIDAVDELRDHDRATLVESLQRLVAESASVVKILITSRDNAHLEALLPADVSKIRVTPALNGADVKAYVQDHLQTAVRSRCLLNGKVSSTLMERTLKALLAGSGEMFLWVRLQIDFLCRRKTERDILSALNTNLSADLDQIYGRTLEAVLQLDHTGQRIARQVLSWLLYARRPFTLDVMRSILRLDPEIQLSEQTDIIDVCHNLIIMDTALDAVVFCHSSVRDFMAQQELFSAGCANELIATVCLRQCIAGPDTELDVCSFSVDGAAVKELYHYAAVHWPEHVRGSSSGSARQNAVSQYMARFVLDETEAMISPAFLVWLEWIRCVLAELPPYHRLSSKLEPLLSAEMSPLFVACVFGLPTLLDNMFASFPEVDLEQRSDTGHTGLYLACLYGHQETVSKLLSHGADLTVECGSFGNPLNVASFRGHLDVVQTLLSHDTASHAANSFSAAFEAACRGSQEAVALYLAKASLSVWTEAEYVAALRQSVEAGFGELVEWLMKPIIAAPFTNKHSINKNKDSAKHLLHIAIRQGQVSVLRSLLRTKPHWAEALPENAMAVAAIPGHVDMLSFLHDLGVTQDEEGPFGSALRSASLMGNEPAVRLLLAWGADVTACGSKGDALQAAAQNGHTQIVRLLLDEGADSDQAGPPRGTPIQAAAFYGHQDTVDLLLERGADMYKDGKSKDALYAAIEGGHEEVAAVFLKRGYRVAAGSALPHVVRGSGSRVVRPWEQRLHVDEWLEIPTDDDDDDGRETSSAINSADNNYGVTDPNPGGSDEDDHSDGFSDDETEISVLELSAATGDIDMIRQEIIRPDVSAHTMLLALKAAVTSGQVHSFRTLINEQAAFFESDIDLRRQLIYAAQHGQAQMVQLISGMLMQGKHGGMEKKTWSTALKAAASSGNTETILVLLRCFHQPTGDLLGVLLSSIRSARANKNTACKETLWKWLLQQQGDQGSPRTLLEACLDLQDSKSPDTLRSGLEDLLNAALWTGNEDMVQFAVAKMEEHGCSVGSILPACASACRRGFSAIKPLLASEYFLNEDRLFTGSYTAAIFNQGAVLSEFLNEQIKRRIDFARKFVLERCLIGAAAHGNLTIVKTLLDSSHLRTRFARFPWAITCAMIAAARHGHEKVVQVCLQGGGDVQAPVMRENMQVVMHWREDGALAIEVDPKEQRRIAFFIPGADMTHNEIGTTELKFETTGPLRDKLRKMVEVIYHGWWTALQAALEGFRNLRSGLSELSQFDDRSAAAEQQQDRIVFLLLDQGCDPNPADASGETSIITAVRFATDGVVQRLLESGAEVPGGDILIQEAAKRSSFRIVLRLLQAGADIPRTKEGLLTTEMLHVLEPRFGDVDSEGYPFSRDEARKVMNSGMRALLRLILSRIFGQQARKSRGMRAMLKSTFSRGSSLNWKRADEPVFGNLLVVAATAGDHECVKLLIEHGVDVTQEFGYTTTTALSGAARYGHAQVMTTLLQNGANSGHDAGFHMENALTQAIQGGQVAAIKILVDHGAAPEPSHQQLAVELKDPDVLELLIRYSGSSETEVLVSACWKGKADHVAAVLAAEARVDSLIHHKCFHPPPGRGTPLYIACQEGHVSIVKQLLRKGADPNLGIKHLLGMPLIAAASAGHLEVVRLLLDSGADPNGHSHSDSEDPAPTALSEACRNGFPAIVNDLLSRGATVTAGPATTLVANPLAVLSTGTWSPSRHGMLELLLEVVSRESNEEREQVLADALAEAALEHNCNAFELILQYVPASSQTLTLASTCGSKSSVMYCLEHGIGVNAADSDGELPLHCASFNLHSSVVQLLIDHGADVNQLECNFRDDEYDEEDEEDEEDEHDEGDGSWEDSEDEEDKSNADSPDDYDNEKTITPLISALAGFHTVLTDEHLRQRARDKPAIVDLETIVQCLLDGGADPEIGHDSNNYKALHIACSIGDLTVVQLLLDRGAKIDSNVENYSSPLFNALAWERPRVVRFLLERGADANAPRVLDSDRTSSSSGEDEQSEHLETPLEAALGYEDKILLRTFLKHARDLEIPDSILILTAERRFGPDAVESGLSDFQIILESEPSRVTSIPGGVWDILDKSQFRINDAIRDLVARRSGDTARVDELREKKESMFPVVDSSRPRALTLVSDLIAMGEESVLRGRT